MKKFLIVAAMVAGIGLAGNAQKLPASKVPDVVKKSFAREHPGINPAWENEDGQFEAGYKQNGSTMSVLYKADGTMTESEVTIKAEDLPAAVKSYVKEHYKGAVIKEASKITQANGSINYEAEVNKMDVRFDANGKFMKESKD